MLDRVIFGFAFLAFLFGGSLLAVNEHNRVANEPQPIAAPVEPVILAEVLDPISKYAFLDFSEKQKKCLALNIYFEARNQSPVGQHAVALVTMNRVLSNKYPNSICDVVYHSKHPGKLHKCQFSWYCDGKSDIPKDTKTWNRVRRLVEGLDRTLSSTQDFTKGSTYYHADYVEPHWADDFTQTVKIGRHIFYRSH